MYYNTSQIAPTYCEKCITICVGEQVYLNTARVQKNLNNEEKTTIKTDVIHGTIPPGDIIPIDDINTIDKIKVYPNPTNSEWNISIYNDVSDKITVSVFELNGKLMHSQINDIIAGENLLKVESKNFNTGNYILEIKGNNVNYREVIIKQ